MAVRTFERDLMIIMIIGEALGNILKIYTEIQISSSRDIIGLRNIIVHAFDSIDPTILWRIMIKDLPLLKDEIRKLKS